MNPARGAAWVILSNELADEVPQIKFVARALPAQLFAGLYVRNWKAAATGLR